MEKRKLIAIALAVAMTTAMFAGCSGENTPSSDTSSSESSSVAETSADPIKATGVVKEMSMNELVVTLEDGSDITLKADGLEGLDSIALGDTVEVEYTEGEDGAVATSVKAAGETEDAESSSTDEEQSSASGAQNPTSSSSEAQTPASSSSGAQSTAPASQTQTPAGNSGSCYDWETPCTYFTAAMSTYTFEDINGNVIAIVEKDGSMDLDKYGYGHYQSKQVGLAKAFNDVRGVETICGDDYAIDTKPVVRLYDPVSDTFSDEWTYVSDVLSGAATTNSTDKADNEGASGDKNEESISEGEAGDVYEAIDLINAERVKAGLSELEIDEDLMEMAAIRAKEMSEVFDHTRPDGSSWRTIFDEFGWSDYNYSGENGGKGRTTAEQQVESWMNSSGHEANILNDQYTKIGVGFYKNHWAMIAVR